MLRQPAHVVISASAALRAADAETSLSPEICTADAAPDPKRKQSQSVGTRHSGDGQRCNKVLADAARIISTDDMPWRNTHGNDDHLLSLATRWRCYPDATACPALEIAR
jgi:hypothetical protein